MCLWFKLLTSRLSSNMDTKSQTILTTLCQRSKVWERGVGLTEACGTGACAAVYAAFKKSLVIPSCCKVILPGGELFIRIENDKIFMSGPVAISFYGVVDPSLFDNI